MLGRYKMKKYIFVECNQEKPEFVCAQIMEENKHRESFRLHSYVRTPVTLLGVKHEFIADKLVFEYDED
jgi:hypothetical protein